MADRGDGWRTLDASVVYVEHRDHESLADLLLRTAAVVEEVNAADPRFQVTSVEIGYQEFEDGGAWDATLLVM